MWNFTGRQDDKQGQYTNLHGNWLSGISFIDKIRLGSQDNLPGDALNNKARNTYYFLPLLLGILGLVFHFKNNPKSFWVLLVFFLFTGLALKVYLNERPFEPRERDYALVGSFYVFALWIGFGAYALFEVAKDYLKPKIALPVVMTIASLAVPVLLISQNWDDHNRSNRYTAQSMAKMYLDSCDENAIIFTIGDNDTFALWYAQGIEGYRQDVRIVNTSLFQTDWYIDDMKKKAYNSDPIPSQLSHDKYKYGSRDFLFYQKTKQDTIDIKTWMNWVANDSQVTQVELESGQFANTFPSKIIRIPVDKEAVLRNGIVDQKDADKIVPFIDIEFKGDVIYKNRLMMLDIIANNNWERPIYFSGGSFGDDDYLWMKDYLQLDGVVYKLVPVRTSIDRNNPFDMGRIDSDKMYDIVMKWDWGNSGDPDIYHDVETRRNGITYRSNLARLADQLIEEGNYKKAENVLDLAMEKMPVEKFEFYSLLEPFVLGYFNIEKPQKAREVYKAVTKQYQEHLLYYSGLHPKHQNAVFEEIYSDLGRYRSLIEILVDNDNEEYAKKEATKFNGYLRLFDSSPSEESLIDTEDNLPESDSLENDLDSISKLDDDTIN
jgi:tetratricopeptide (TPR) repeat protein